MSKQVHKRSSLYMVYRKKHFLLFRGPAIAFALIIIFLSSLPGYKLPELNVFLGDKIVHILEYGLFGILLYRAFRYPQPLPMPFKLTLILGIPFAALDELHQYLVPGRRCDITDFTADVFGLVFFTGIVALINMKTKSIKTNR